MDDSDHSALLGSSVRSACLRMIAGKVGVLALAFAMPPTALVAEDKMAVFEDFSSDPASRWTFVTDGVMGGVSQGQAKFTENDVSLTGNVSTQNNGGFIQVRNRFGGGWPADAKGLRLSAKGNGETYFVFLRTQGLARVWFSYRAAFIVSQDWQEIDLDFDAFAPSHPGMPPTFTPDQVISIGIVAYGRDHRAEVSVRSIMLY